jgi:WD40 repeat protein
MLRTNELGQQANVVAFSPDGRSLAIGSEDWDIYLVELGGGKQSGTVTGHLDQVTGLAYAPDGKTLVSSAMDCTLRFWDVSSGLPKMNRGDPPSRR